MGQQPLCHFFHPSVIVAPYLRNRTSSNHSFWYACVKWWFLQVFFFLFFSNFHSSGYDRGKGQISSKWKITVTSVMQHIFQEHYSIWSWILGHFCKMGSAEFCCYCCCCFEIFIFQAVRGVKGKKLAQNETITSVTHHIPGTV